VQELETTTTQDQTYSTRSPAGQGLSWHGDIYNDDFIGIAQMEALEEKVQCTVPDIISTVFHLNDSRDINQKESISESKIQKAMPHG